MTEQRFGGPIDPPNTGGVDCTQYVPTDTTQFSCGGLIKDTDSNPHMLRLRISALQLVAKTQNDRIVTLESELKEQRDITEEWQRQCETAEVENVAQKTKIEELDAANSAALDLNNSLLDSLAESQAKNQDLRLQLDGLKGIRDALGKAVTVLKTMPPILNPIHEMQDRIAELEAQIAEVESRLKDREAVADTNTRYWAGEHSRLESIINGFVDGDELAQAKERIEGLEAKNQELVNAVAELVAENDNWDKLCSDQKEWIKELEAERETADIYIDLSDQALSKEIGKRRKWKRRAKAWETKTWTDLANGHTPRVLKPGDPEPPRGSIVSIPNEFPWLRPMSNGCRWERSGSLIVWKNFDLTKGYVLLREGWGSDE